MASRKDESDAALTAAQQDFLSSDSRPAAKVIRKAAAGSAQNDASRQGEGGSDGNGAQWYQQMKGVRFRLDDFETETSELKMSTQSQRDRGKNPKQARDMMGPVVERTTGSSVPVFSSPGSQKSATGFPAPRRLNRKHLQTQIHPPTEPNPLNQQSQRELMEEIDRENRKKLGEMSEEEILQLQESLRKSLPASVQEKLLRGDLSKLDSNESQSTRSNPPVRSKPLISPSETSETLAEESFDAHLRTYFPSSTSSVEQPEWTLPVYPAEETFFSSPDNSKPLPSSMRFDFNGNYIPPSISRSLPTHLGLHHHAHDPGSAGYTLPELSILARSTQPSQKCIALKIIGFVLVDIVTGKYDWDVTEGLWDEVDGERIIEILLEVAKGGTEASGNRSVLRYAEDALDKWVDAGGPKVWEERLRKKGFERVDGPESDE